MQLRDIVEINQQGLVADAVTLSMMADDEKNLPLCKGFVFNYDVLQPKFSTLGVLDALRESFHSANNSNVHLMVQDFGKGKSHFALTVANFFKQSANTSEVEGILHQISFATSGKAQAIYERIKAYKTRSKPHLVLCISGEVQADLGKMLLQALRSALEEHSIGDAIAQHLIQKPLTYLQQLSGEKRIQVEAYLEEIGRPYGDLDSMTELLAEDNYDIIPTVVDISAKVEDFAYNFEYNLDIEKILEDAIYSLCVGENRQFEGVLILFDELNAYLRTWLKNPQAAGNYALQNLTNVCGRNRGKVVLLCLAQIKPSIDNQVPHLDRKNYERFTTRIELAPSTYEPKSSLELVIDNLLKQSDGAQWQSFHSCWGNSLRGESQIAYESYITAYSKQSWPFSEFYKHLGLGCYPLHPFTAYLLCNLEFTQGRTVIQFIKEDVAEFIKNTAVEDEIKFVRPVQLIDAFQSNFAQKSIYEDFKKSHDNIAANASEDEIIVLKAIGLYYLSGDKVKKPANEKHEELLSLMTGFSVSKTKKILVKLADEYQAVYHNSGDNTYRFYSGFSINDLRRKIEEDIEKRTPRLSDLLKECRKNLSHYLGRETVRGDSFVAQNRLNGEDWQFDQEVFTVDQFQRILSTERTIRGLSERGLIAYFIGEYDQDLATLEKHAESILAKAPETIQERIILAIPRRGTRDLARVLLMKNTLSEKSTLAKQEFGQALTELKKQLDTQLDTGLQDIFDSCVYTCRIIHKVPTADRKRLEPIASKMLEELYTYVPPVENQEKLRTKSTKGSSIISYASRQLLANDLKKPFPDKAHDTLLRNVFVNRWGLLKPGKPYSIQTPTNPSIRQAWDTISEMTDIVEREQSIIEIKQIWEKLSAAPFGYNELTFTMLFSAWLAYHRAEVELSGGFGIPRRKSDSVTNKSAPIHEWAQTNILEKAKDFVHTWIIQMRNKVIRRKPDVINIPNSSDYNTAISLVEKIKNHRQSGLLDPSKAKDLEKQSKQLQKGIKEINEWFQPTIEAQKILNRNPSLDSLAKYYVPLETSAPFVIKEDVKTVRATEDQANTWKQTRQALRDTLENLVDTMSNEAQVFENLDDGYSLKAKLEHQVQALSNVPELPSRFIESLRSTLDLVKQRLHQLKESEKTREVLGQIRNLYKTLGANATQNQYNSVLNRIQKLTEQNSAVQQEEDYLQILTDIEKQQDVLTHKLDQWESDFASVCSTSEAYKLSQEINRELTRFDQEDSHQQITSLINRVEARILEQQNEEAEESSLTSAVQQARQKVQSIIKLKTLIDSIQAYDDLTKITIPSTQKISNREEYQQQLEDQKIEGRQVIEQKLDHLFEACDRELKKPDDYKQLKSFITRSHTLIGEHAEFASLLSRLREAETTLEAKYQDLLKRIEDSKLIREIQSLQPGMGNTIKRCEEILAQIEVVKSRLNFPEQSVDSINRLVNAFQGKQAEYSIELDKLTSQIETVETIAQLQGIRNDLSKLEFVFRDSAEYNRYQVLGEQLKYLQEDLGLMASFESQSQNAQSLIKIIEVLTAINNGQAQFKNHDRFQHKLNDLASALQIRHQQYIDELNRWQEQVVTLSEMNTISQLRSQVSTQAYRYLGSEYETTYTAVTTDLEHLSQLIAIVDTRNTDSIEAYEAELERLQEWKTSQASLSEQLEQRIETAKQDLINSQKEIRKRGRYAAQQWLMNLQEDVVKLNSLKDSREKLKWANALLKQIRQSRNQHETYLEDSQRDRLLEVIEDCKTIQNQDLSSKIEVLFRELPTAERVTLYQRLATYLDTTTEVF